MDSELLNDSAGGGNEEDETPGSLNNVTGHSRSMANLQVDQRARFGEFFNNISVKVMFKC